MQSFRRHTPDNLPEEVNCLNKRIHDYFIYALDEILISFLHKEVTNSAI